MLKALRNLLNRETQTTYQENIPTQVGNSWQIASPGSSEVVRSACKIAAFKEPSSTYSNPPVIPVKPQQIKQLSSDSPKNNSTEALQLISIQSCAAPQITVLPRKYEIVSIPTNWDEFRNIIRNELKLKAVLAVCSEVSKSYLSTSAITYLELIKAQSNPELKLELSVQIYTQFLMFIEQQKKEEIDMCLARKIELESEYQKISGFFNF